jgi:hypothetical protein
MKKTVLVMILLALLAGGLQAEDIRVIVPYLGAAERLQNRLARRLEDTKLMEGSSSIG